MFTFCRAIQNSLYAKENIFQKFNNPFDLISTFLHAF